MPYLSGNDQPREDLLGQMGSEAQRGWRECEGYRRDKDGGRSAAATLSCRILETDRNAALCKPMVGEERDWERGAEWVC
jgi:hypothetical protein